MPHQPSLTVVIPLGPGEREAEGLLSHLHAVVGAAEVILVHAGPPGPALPPGWPAGRPLVQLASGPGRARQMNRGAAQAGGRWLWFLHADSRLQAGCGDGLAAFLARDERVLGWFALAFRDDGPAMARLNAAGANLRARWLGIPFGDQGFVVRKADFDALGGFDESAAHGEDHLFVWSARHAGLATRRIDGAIATSARKYARLGWARTTALHWRLTVQQAWHGWRR